MTFTLQQISELYSYRHRLTKDRFFHYMNLKFGYDEKDIKEMWLLWSRFPHFFSNGMQDADLVEKLISGLTIIVADLEKGWDISLNIKKHDSYRKEIRLIVYEENGQVHKSEIDLLDATDIFAYADLLRRDVKVLDVLVCLERINGNKNSDAEEGYLNIYEGDIFSVNDDFFGKDRSGLYLVQRSGMESSYGALYKRLLYIKGKGYLLNGKPNIDNEKDYNHYIMTMSKEWTKIGNLATDMHLLQD